MGLLGVVVVVVGAKLSKVGEGRGVSDGDRVVERRVGGWYVALPPKMVPGTVAEPPPYIEKLEVEEGPSCEEVWGLSSESSWSLSPPLPLRGCCC